MKINDLLREGRVGEVVISSDLANYEEFEVLSQVMSMMFVTRCEHEYVSDMFVYTAVSPAFRKTDAGEAPPRYNAIVEEVDDEVIEVKFEERKL